MYEVYIEQSAERDLSRLPEETLHRIASRIRALAQDPRPSGCRKIKGSKNDWWIRIGQYRVIYEVDDKSKKVWVMHVRKRESAYRGMLYGFSAEQS